MQVSHETNDTHHHPHAHMFTHHIVQEQLAQQILIIKITGTENFQKSAS